MLGERLDAARAWQDFSAALLGHIYGEETVILPAYVSLVSPRRGADASVFRREHQRLRRFVSELDAWLAAWHGRVLPPGEVILLVERQKTLKELLEHHDEREEGALYPDLANAASRTRQQQLLQHFLGAEQQHAAGFGDEVTVPHGPRQAALLAIGWLAPLYADVTAGNSRPRMPAPWDEAAGRLHALQAEIIKGEGAGTATLSELCDLLDRVTPMKAFPVARASDVHACWQLLQAAFRAAAVPSADGAGDA